MCVASTYALVFAFLIAGANVGSTLGKCYIDAAECLGGTCSLLLLGDSCGDHDCPDVKAKIRLKGNLLGNTTVRS